MSLWWQTRYYCINTAGGCRYAARDVPFSSREFKKFEGRCRGDKGDGCGAALALGDPRDLRPRWVLVGLLIVGGGVGAGWGLRTWVFPPPVAHVEFVMSEVHTDDRVGLLKLDIIRKANLQGRMRVEYASADGSAKAGEDYEPVHAWLTFEPKESRKTLQVKLLPDATLQKETRDFTVVLVNVVGTPTETIQIAPRAVDRTVQMQAEQAVRSASRIAADIASFMVKRRVLLKLLTARAGTEAEAHTYEQQLLEVEDNLSRAREGYLQALRDLQTYQAPVVMHAIDHLHEDLENKHFSQQSRALWIMKSQFMELVDKKGTDIDRWVQELESAVPHLDSRNPESST